MTIYRRSDDALGAPLGESLVVLNMQSLKYFELNQVSSRIWEIFDDGPASVETIRDRLCADFAVSPEVCEAAVKRFFDEALAKGLVTN
jgi:hypothetical protein